MHLRRAGNKSQSLKLTLSGNCVFEAPRKITSLNARAKKETMQRIAYENQLMLGRLIRGKSTMSVNEWEKSHQARQKLLKRFGVHPYVLNQKADFVDPN